MKDNRDLYHNRYGNDVLFDAYRPKETATYRRVLDRNSDFKTTLRWY